MKNEEKSEALRKTALPNPLHNGYGMWLSSTDVDKILIEMAKWKDEQFNEERKELLGLVKMLPVNENNQTIIEDLIGMLE